MKSKAQVSVEKMPTKPDPLWPAGAEPMHLSPAVRESKEIIAPFNDLIVWKCEKCGSTVGKSISSDKYCHDCYATEVQNSSLAQKVNATWMDQAEELGLKLFERQPEETAEEWRVWEKYRSFYPMKLPTWTELAAKCGCCVATVTRIAAKWSFKVRLVSWATFVDQSMQEERVTAIQEMNTKQLSMAKNIQEKLQTAIGLIDPNTLKPNEIVNLYKVSTDMERKIVTYMPEKVVTETGESAKKQMTTTKPEDLAEVIAILLKTGALDGKSIGIEQTTRIVAKEED